MDDKRPNQPGYRDRKKSASLNPAMEVRLAAVAASLRASGRRRNQAVLGQLGFFLDKQLAQHRYRFGIGFLCEAFLEVSDIRSDDEP